MPHVPSVEEELWQVERLSTAANWDKSQEFSQMSHEILTVYVGGYIYCTLTPLLCLALEKLKKFSTVANKDNPKVHEWVRIVIRISDWGGYA